MAKRKHKNTTKVWRAYCFASGQIGFTDETPPNGALIFATHSDEKTLRDTTTGLARLAYDNKTWLVPGCPEARDQSEALSAMERFAGRIELALSRNAA